MTQEKIKGSREWTIQSKPVLYLWVTIDDKKAKALDRRLQIRKL